ncbi:MAG: hypothetical protein AB4042_16290 [Leptolyngbyaceae cyanobacterium]
MADAIRQIRQELNALTQAIAILATDLDAAYDEYLTALRTSIQKQAVLACYHLCTHGHPERFLRLSFRQREALQQAIQTCIYQAQQRLMNAYILAITPPKPEEEDQPKRGKRRRSLPPSDHPLARSRRRSPDDEDGPSVEFIAIGGDIDEEDVMAIANDPSLAAALGDLADNLSLDRADVAERIKHELLSKLSEVDIEDDADDHDEEGRDEEDRDEEGRENSLPWAEGKEGQHSKDNENEDNETVERSEDNPTVANSSPGVVEPSKESKTLNEASEAVDAKYTKFAAADEMPTPVELLVRQDHLERNVAEVLRDLSQQVNHQLHQTGMLPRKLPGAVLEAALKSEASAEPSSGPPNILSLLVEAEGKSKHSKVMRIKVVNLRLSELEFIDHYLSSRRSRLRELTEKLQKMGKTYEKKQRSRAVAEAEAAWRSSWYERED